MYGLTIAFTMSLSEERFTIIQDTLEANGFSQEYMGFFVNDTNDLCTVYKAIYTLASIPWIAESANRVHVFRISDYSDFTDIVKHKKL